MNSSSKCRAEKVRKRFDRVASIYDIIDNLLIPTELRQKAVNLAFGSVLEIGVGTGHNLSLYSAGCTVTGIDFSSLMLQKAQGRVNNVNNVNNKDIKLVQMNVEQMDFPDNFFDTVLGVFVFCSVPNPLAGLKEVRRVCRNNGRIILLEHVRSNNFIAGKIMDMLNPLVHHLIGDNINRCTVENLHRAGLTITHVENYMRSIVKLITALP